MGGHDKKKEAPATGAKAADTVPPAADGKAANKGDAKVEAKGGAKKNLKKK